MFNRMSETCAMRNHSKMIFLTMKEEWEFSQVHRMMLQTMFFFCFFVWGHIYSMNVLFFSQVETTCGFCVHTNGPSKCLMQKVCAYCVLCSCLYDVV